MIRVVITGWLPGFRKIEANKVLRAYLGYDLRESKDAVDSILNGEIVEFALADGQAVQLCKELELLGAISHLEALD